jgi:hypothetical protein
MEIDKTTDSSWPEWRDFLINAYESGMLAFQGKGASSVIKNFTALFLQARGFDVPPAAVLPNAVNILNGQFINNPLYDTLAMAGHRIGMAMNTADLKQYLKDLHNTMKPEGQILLTSFHLISTFEPGKKFYRQKNPGAGMAQFQSENLTGPYFCTLRVNAEILKSQAIASNWKFEMIHRQDDDNYAALLTCNN